MRPAWTALGVRGRLFAVSVAVVVFGGLATGLLLEVQLRGWLTSRIDERLVRDARLVAVLMDQGVGADDATLEDVTHRAGQAIAARVTVIRADGVVAADSALTADQSAGLDNHGTRPEVVEARATGEGRATRYSATLQRTMRYIALRVAAAGDIATVRVSVSADSIDEIVGHLRLIIAIAGVIGLLLALAMSALASHLFSGALRELVSQASAQVARIQAGRGYDLLPTDGPAEVAGLARALNEMGSDLATVLSQVAAERDRFRGMLDGMGVALLAVDDQQVVRLSNSVTRELLDLSVEPEGRPLTDLLREPSLHAHMSARRSEHVGAGGDLDLVEFVLPGTRRSLLAHVTPMRGDDGGAVIVIQDISELRRLESVRRDFVANVSHELRTPVSVIRANTETMLDGAMEQPEMARRFLQASLRNAVRLSKLIDELLDLSRIESGRADLEVTPVPVGRVASATLDTLRDSAQRRSMTLTSEVGDVSVLANARALEQILTNLVDNAVKYGREGGHVVIRARDEDDRVVVEVEDDGPGVEQRHRARLFERFYRVDPGRSRDMGGTGLGLAIVKHLAASMGASVGMEPVSPTGSRFWVELPVVKPGTRSAQSRRSSGSGGRPGGGALTGAPGADTALPDTPLAEPPVADLRQPAGGGARGPSDLQPIRDRLLLMAGRVETMVVRSVDALVERDADLARATILSDREVNQDEIDLDALCRTALAEGPREPDGLAFLTLTLKMVTDLERIGDLAVSVCERAIDLAPLPLLGPHPHIPNHHIPIMGGLARTMVRDAIDAFIAQDVGLARSVVERDDEVDELYHRVFKHLLAVMLDDSGIVERGVHILSAAKCIERMADHSTNLAEQVVLLVRGTDIRHQGKRDGP